MDKRVLSGVEWCTYNKLFGLQRIGVLPEYPWDTMEIGEESCQGYDEAFGGGWQILERGFTFQWDVLPNILPSTPVRNVTTLKLRMRGEIPVGTGGKQMESKEAQRRWYIDGFRLERPTGKMVGEISEITVLEAESRDDVFRLLNPKVEKGAA
jgi:hypothetical protein